MPIVRYNTLRLLFAMTTIEDLKLYQIDMISMYLAGELDKIIYMHFSEGYTVKEGKYYHLKKSIYSFKQAVQV